MLMWQVLIKALKLLVNRKNDRTTSEANDDISHRLQQRKQFYRDQKEGTNEMKYIHVKYLV
jgi:hypothetical protein